MIEKHDRSKLRRPSVSLATYTSEYIPATNPGLFVSAKARTAIPVRHAAIRDALIVASLDPLVSSISYVESAVVASEQAYLDAIIVQRGDGRFLLDPVPARRILDFDQAGLAMIALDQLNIKPWVITAKELQREPRYSNALFVWGYNGHRVPRELRKHIMQAVTDKEPVELGRLERTIRSGRDLFPFIMALVCADVLEMDLTSQAIKSTSTVKVAHDQIE